MNKLLLIAALLMLTGCIEDRVAGTDPVSDTIVAKLENGCEVHLLVLQSSRQFLTSTAQPRVYLAYCPSGSASVTWDCHKSTCQSATIEKANYDQNRG